MLSLAMRVFVERNEMREGNFKLILGLHGKRCEPIKSVNINLGFFSIAVKRHDEQRNLYKEELGAFLQFLRVSPSPSWQSTRQWPGRHGAVAVAVAVGSMFICKHKA